MPVGTGETINLPDYAPDPAPCPFCGWQKRETSELTYQGYGPPPGYAMVCGNCGAEGPMGTGKARDDHYNAHIAAVVRWNERFSLKADDGSGSAQ